MSWSYENDVRKSMTFNTTYYGGIGVYTTDLYPPYNYPESSVSWSNTACGTGVIVHWLNVPYYDFRNEKVTVHSRLKQDGQVTLYWESIGMACVEAGECDATYLMAGIRDSIQSREKSFLTTTAEQDALAKDVWKTPVKGVYPGKVDSLQPGKLFHMCPISDSWSIAPSYFEQNAATTITLTTLATSCNAQFAGIRCVFVGSADGGSEYASAASFNYAPDENGAPFYTCVVPDEVSASAGAYLVDLVGVFDNPVLTELGSTNAVSLLPQADLQKGTVTVNVVAPGDAHLDQPDLCVATEALSQVSDKAGCGPCALSKQMMDCVTGDFACPAVASPQDCHGECPPPLAPQTTDYVPKEWDTLNFMSWNWTDRNFYYKDTSTCCEAAEIDCAGVCSGRKIALSKTAIDAREDGSRSS